jgi:hypothetical protein
MEIADGTAFTIDELGFIQLAAAGSSRRWRAANWT